MQKTCGECGAASTRLRKGRCNACYMRIYRRGEVGEGACCEVCSERRRAVLAMTELDDRAVVLCGNCTLVLVRTRPRIDTVSELARRVSRERRIIPDRRRIYASTDVDRRVAYRRSVERRPAASPAPLKPAFDPSVD